MEGSRKETPNGGRSLRDPALTGIDAHSSATLLPRDIETVDGIRCTTVARTLLLGAVLAPRVVERAFDEAEAREVLDARQIEDDAAKRIRT